MYRRNRLNFMCGGDGGGGEGDFGVGNEGSTFGGQDPADFGGMGPSIGGGGNFRGDEENPTMQGFHDTLDAFNQDVADTNAALEEAAQTDLENKAGWISAISKGIYAALIAGVSLFGSPIIGGAMAIATPLAKRGFDKLAANIAKGMVANPNMTTEQAVNQALDKGEGLIGSEYLSGAGREQMVSHLTKTIGEKNPVSASPAPIQLGPGGLREVGEGAKPREIFGDEERALLDQMEENEIAKFTDEVMKRSGEINATAVADLVNRGVLQGTVGENVLARLNEDTMDIISQGTTDIQTQRMGSELSLISQGKELALKGEALDWDKARWGEEFDWAKSKWTENLDWEKQRWGEDLDLRKYLGNERSDALDDANKWGAFGNIMGGTIGGLWGSSGGTDWSKYF
ncbi:MAG: hypothetical protein GY774_35750 [Planctomycetes bacterium]|nr:hypothetical protein [Planctomycetota bacterium]